MNKSEHICFLQSLNVLFIDVGPYVKWGDEQLAGDADWVMIFEESTFLVYEQMADEPFVKRWLVAIADRLNAKMKMRGECRSAKRQTKLQNKMTTKRNIKTNRNIGALDSFLCSLQMCWKCGERKRLFQLETAGVRIFPAFFHLIVEISKLMRRKTQRLLCACKDRSCCVVLIQHNWK